VSAYRGLLERLYRARGGGVRLELDRIAACLAALGHPERRFALRVHVGGTNGKGSTAAFVESMLRAAGWRTGLFTSPHLSRFNERFAVAGEPLPDEAIQEAGAAVEAVVARLAPERSPTFFELATAMGLHAFARAGVEVAVLEVGLGGRFDATNAVDAEVAAVTGVALDHQAYLGDTLDAIAFEKAGIFKPGRRAVVGAAGEPAAVERLCALARAAGSAEVTVVDPAARAPAGWRLGLAGEHQQRNAACALAVVDQLEAAGAGRIGDAARARGLAEVRFPGRLETLPSDGGPRLVVDGAHNPHAAATLARALAALPARRRVVILGVSADKDVAGVVAPLVAGADRVVATRSQQERALAPDRLAAVVRAARPEVDLVQADHAAAALAAARQGAGADDLVVVAGSLFLVGEAREVCLGVAPDPVRLSDPMKRAAG
jgi:dihydrofolate synthase/folylpolyglutamate synthase